MVQNVVHDCYYRAVGYVYEHDDDDLDRVCDHGCGYDDHGHGCAGHSSGRGAQKCDDHYNRYGVDHGYECDDHYDRDGDAHSSEGDDHGYESDDHYDRDGDGHSSEGDDHGYGSDDHDGDGHDCSSCDRVPDASGCRVDVDRVCVHVEYRVANDLYNALDYFDSRYILYKWTEVLEPDNPRHTF